ncbi:Flp family type IVb pilin [Burkholderia cenocepacia]|uniref:Flp family type IVb pilin n=1 Tax=Burkholderia cenocepacia TaxID=95486 RepID=UPI002AAFE97A|nr:Flp family type IVb pilin [Burkholderia cenocepacia]
MSRIIEKIAWFVQDQDGVTAIEYGLIAALIAIGTRLHSAPSRHSAPTRTLRRRKTGISLG